jgi:hypothetical protein
VDRVRELLAGDDEQREAIRALGGLLLGIGMLLVFFRRGSPFFGGEPWGDAALFLVLLAPCAFLYGSGFIAARATGATRPWNAVYLIFGTLLVPLVLFQFLEWVGGNTDAPLNVAWIFLLTAVAGKVASLFARVRFGLLITGLAIIVSWLALWDELLADGVFDDIGTLRGLLVLIAAILVIGAFALWRMDRAGTVLFGMERDPDAARSGELVTAAGVAAVAAGAISVGAFPTLFTPIVPLEGAAAPPGFGSPVDASLLWDLELLVASLLLIGAGSWLGMRGPAYVGAIGILLFAVIVGFDLDDDSPAGKLLGWPLILLLLGAAAFVASFLSGLRMGRLRPGGGEPPAPPPPPPPAPSAPPAPGQT